MLIAYLTAAASAAERPLHDRLAVLWASTTLPDLLSDSARAALVGEALQKQSADGGWSDAALGPWKRHPEAPAASGSSAFATGYVTYVLLNAGTARSHPAIGRALSWLESHQDPKTGAWAAISMNKRYPDGSMPLLFMQDAATAFASMALLAAGR
jgi:squalene-hopene/tetraprenyl-beta-curcumene cyclase